LQGAFAKPGQFPYAAKLFISKNEGYFGCGGALITPRAVLTAAHCVYDNNNKQVSPKALELLIGVTDASVPAPSYFADRIITPKYNPATTFGDVAIVRLTQAVVNATTVAMLAPTTQVKDGWRLTVYGWWVYCNRNENSMFMLFLIHCF
jgi:secreted trypsin-like serine protease